MELVHALFLLAAALYTVHFFIQWRRYPGPMPVPFFGHMIQATLRNHRLPDVHVESVAEYGSTYSVTLAGKRIINTADPANVRHILADNFDNYVKGPTFYHIMHDILGDGIFNVDGDTWRVQRKTASHEFSVRRFRDFNMQVFNSHADKFAQRLAQLADSGEQADMAAMYNAFTLDSICVIAFGFDPRSLDGEDASFGPNFDLATALSPPRLRQPWWRLEKALGVGRERRLADAVQVVRAFTDRIIAERHAQGVEGRQDLLSRFMALRGPDGQPFPDSYLRDVCVNFVLAGRDTTADCLAWTTHLLETNPAALARMRAEIDTLPAEPAYDDVWALQYLKAVVHESLRLFPSVPSDPKEAVDHDVLPSGFPVPKGAWVVYMPYAMGRQTSIWGDDALDFKPERFLDPATGAFQNPDPFKYPVFQAGPRTCLGQRLAVLEVAVLLARVFREFDLRRKPGHEVGYLRSTTLRMKPFPMTAVRRSASS